MGTVSYRPTPRERQVLDAMVAGTGTTLDICERLGMREGTARVHVYNICVATGLHTRMQLAVWWVLTGRYLS